MQISSDAPSKHGEELATDGPAETHSAEQIWEGATEELRSALPEGNFTTWFAKARAVGLDGGTFVLGVPSTFVKEWIEQR